MPINALDFRVLGTDKDFFWSESQEAFVDRHAHRHLAARHRYPAVAHAERSASAAQAGINS